MSRRIGPPPGWGRPSQRGQTLVLFALALTVMIAGVGLVIDGGGVFAQRRAQQTAADMAALAGANQYLVTNDAAGAVDRARAVAAANGYTHGQQGTVVVVDVSTDVGAEVKVRIDALHANYFAGLLGMSTWSVSTTATALAGFPDSAYGGPFIFNIAAFTDDGMPRSAYGDPGDAFGFTQTSGDAPDRPSRFAWTNYGTGNVNTTQVHKIITGETVVRRTLAFGEYIGQRNSGNHTALFNDVAAYLIGQDVPAPVVDDNGGFMGWAVFHVERVDLPGNGDGSDDDGGDDGNGTPRVFGWFLSSAISRDMTISGCTQDECPRFLGTYVLRLVD